MYHNLAATNMVWRLIIADLMTKPVSKGVLDKLLMTFCGYSVFNESKLKSMTDYK